MFFATTARHFSVPYEVFPYLVPVITLSAFSVPQESCLFFSMEWFKFTSFSYLQLLLTVDLDAFLRYRMSHQDLFSAHQTTYATLLKHLKLRFSIVYFLSLLFWVFITLHCEFLIFDPRPGFRPSRGSLCWDFLIKALNSYRTSFLLHLVQILNLFFFFFWAVGGRGEGVKRILASIFWKDGTYVGFYHNETKRSSFPVMTVSCVDNKG